MEIKPDKTSLVQVYELYKAIGIIPLNDLQKRLLLKFKNEQFPAITKIQETANLPLQYMRVYTTDKYIYALYAGKTVNELMSGKVTKLSVHVFGWDGTARCELQLNRLINCFCVDEENTVLY
ncbi:MAG: TolB-like 6-bladed beta-propeller domain-containing protein [Tannerellaceae bacterium]|jgi:hypothetical protein|nr:TolB-like 6-bladed beta-propeller domain-containing protein [Tannerellaceae bacterium]